VVGNEVAGGIKENGVVVGDTTVGEVDRVVGVASGISATLGATDGNGLTGGSVCMVSSESGCNEIGKRSEGVLVAGDGAPTGDGISPTGGRVCMMSSEAGCNEIGKRPEGVLVAGDGASTGAVSDVGVEVLPGADTGESVIIGAGFNVSSNVVGGSPTGASIAGAEVGFFDFDVGDVPGFMLIESPLGTGDTLVLIGASDGEKITKFVGPDVALGGSASTVTVATTLPVLESYVVVSTCPHSF
jgi:hypothetical protein